MPVEHLAPSEGAERIQKTLERDGACVVDRLVDRAVLERVRDELAPYLERASPGPDEFSGHRTRRIGGLIARSKTCRELIEHPLVLGPSRPCSGTRPTSTCT